MAATEIRSWPARAASSWRALERMPAYQVPIVLGGALAALVGVVALGVAVVAERVLGISWVPVREGQASRILPTGRPAILVFLILFEHPRPPVAESGIEQPRATRQNDS